ncbi:armadillo-type protein [Globomyces pollinis-pini]|nr:armadillo-type protein [Globomyces pollinis-pini]
MMDSGVHEMIRNALSTIHNPLSSNEQRLSAQNYCDVQKQNFKLDIALGLANDPNYTVRFFGLDMILYAVEHTSHHDQLKPTIVSLIQCFTENDPKYLKVKYSQLVVALVKRIWPQQWTDFDLILRSFHDNEATFEISLMILKSLIEDVFIYDDPLANQRKLPLSTSLMAVSFGQKFGNVWFEKQKGANNADLDLLLNIVRADTINEGWIIRTLDDLKKCYSFLLISKNDAQQRRLEELTILCLYTLSSFLEWVPFSALLETETMSLLFQLIHSPNMKIVDVVVDLITLLFSHHISIDEEDVRFELIVNPLLTGGLLQQTLSLWSNLNSYVQSQITQHSSIPEVEYGILKKISKMISVFGINQICFKKNTTIPNGFPLYLESIIKLIEHPSLSISLIGIDFVYEAYRHEYMAKNSLNSPQSIYLEFDGENDIEVHVILTQNTVKRLDIMKHITCSNHNFAFSWINNQLKLYFTNQGSDYTVASLTKALEVIMISIPEEFLTGIEQNQPLIFEMGQLLNAILDLSIQDLKIVVHQLSMVVTFSSVLKLYPALIYKCLEKFFFFCAFNVTSSDAKANEDELAVRHRAASSILKLGLTIPDSLTPFFEQLLESITSMTKQHKIMKRESRLLTEFLIATMLGSSLPSNTHREYLNRILEPDLNDYNVLSKSLQEFGSFQKFCGIESLAKILSNPAIDLNLEKGEDFEQYNNNRKKLMGFISSFWQYLKRSFDVTKDDLTKSQQLWIPFLELLTPVVFSCISEVHNLWDANLLKSFPILLVKITLLTPRERMLAIDNEISKQANVNAVEHSLDAEIFNIASWLGRMREVNYQLLGTMTRFSEYLYGRQEFCENFTRSIVSKTGFVSTHHWKSLISAVLVPFVLNCPPKLYPEYFSPNMVGICNQLNQKCALEWQKIIDDSLTDNLDPSDVTDDIIDDRLKRQFTRAYSEFWSTIFSTTQNPALETVFKHDSLVNYIDFFGVCKTGLLLLLSIRDTKCCSQILWTLLKWMPCVEKSLHLRDFTGNHILFSVLNILNNPYQKSNHDVAWQLFVQIVDTIDPHSRIIRQNLMTINGLSEAEIEKFCCASGTLKYRTQMAKKFLSSVLKSDTPLTKERRYVYDGIFEKLVNTKGKDIFDTSEVQVFGDLFE